LIPSAAAFVVAMLSIEAGATHAPCDDVSVLTSRLAAIGKMEWTRSDAAVVRKQWPIPGAWNVSRSADLETLSDLRLVADGACECCAMLGFERARAGRLRFVSVFISTVDRQEALAAAHAFVLAAEAGMTPSFIGDLEGERDLAIQRVRWGNSAGAVVADATLEVAKSATGWTLHFYWTRQASPVRTHPSR
jgi:hypothetical protein